MSESGRKGLDETESFHCFGDFSGSGACPGEAEGDYGAYAAAALP
jgi:hypothetical protein